jgi:hypothetical protein
MNPTVEITVPLQHSEGKKNAHKVLWSLIATATQQYPILEITAASISGEKTPIHKALWSLIRTATGHTSRPRSPSLGRSGASCATVGSSAGCAVSDVKGGVRFQGQETGTRKIGSTRQRIANEQPDSVPITIRTILIVNMTEIHNRTCCLTFLRSASNPSLSRFRAAALRRRCAVLRICVPPCGHAHQRGLRAPI